MSTRKIPDRLPGRPRDVEADAAILDAALDRLIECGIEATTIEQVAKRAGVTRPTVYRRFSNKTEMLVAAIHMAHVGDRSLPELPVCRDIEQMLSMWAQALSHPRRRRLMRRLMTSLHDYPALHETYWNASLKRRDEWIQSVLKGSRDRGEFPSDVNLEVIQQILTGAVAAHLATYPDSSTSREIEAYLLSVLRQTCYRRT